MAEILAISGAAATSVGYPAEPKETSEEIGDLQLELLKVGDGLEDEEEEEELSLELEEILKTCNIGQPASSGREAESRDEKADRGGL